MSSKELFQLFISYGLVPLPLLLGLWIVYFRLSLRRMRPGARDHLLSMLLRGAIASGFAGLFTVVTGALAHYLIFRERFAFLLAVLFLMRAFPFALVLGSLASIISVRISNVVHPGGNSLVTAVSVSAFIGFLTPWIGVTIFLLFSRYL